MKRLLSAMLCLLLCGALALPSLAQADIEPLVGMDVPFSITETQTVIETDRFVLRIEPGVYVPDSIQDDINLVMDTAEDILGLSFSPKKPIRSDIGKVEIEVLNPDLNDGTFPAYGGMSGAVVSAPDILIHGGGGWALLHELTHCLHFRNGYSLSSALNEGITTNTVYEATGKAAFPISLDSHFNYAINENLPNEENALSLFLGLDHTDDGWNNYLYGFPMVLFLKETYGKDALQALILRVQRDTQTNEALVPIIQDVTSEDFFARFGRWYGEYTESYLSQPRPANDYARFDRLLIYPQMYFIQSYDSIMTSYQDGMVLDYTAGYRYLTDYKHITPIGFSGMIAAQGQTTFAFYTAAGEALETHTLNGDILHVTVPGAALIHLTGDGAMVTIKADYDAMTATP